MELKPCPFCGGEAHLTCEVASRWYIIRCLRCGAASAKIASPKRVIEAWNRRFDNDRD